MKKIIVGITGASGAIYSLRLIEFLIRHELKLHIIISENGCKVLKYETGIDLKEQVDAWNKSKAEMIKAETIRAEIILEDNTNMFSAVASGSYRCDAMVIIPCSMSTLAEIANGITKTLLTRTADVMIKEQRKLVIVPRETPLSPIHLKNMYELSKLGITILPAMPGFYNKPSTVDDMVGFVVGKVLDSLGIDNNCYLRWASQDVKEKE